MCAARCLGGAVINAKYSPKWLLWKECVLCLPVLLAPRRLNARLKTTYVAYSKLEPTNPHLKKTNKTKPKQNKTREMKPKYHQRNSVLVFFIRLGTSLKVAATY